MLNPYLVDSFFQVVAPLRFPFRFPFFPIGRLPLVDLNPNSRLCSSTLVVGIGGLVGIRDAEEDQEDGSLLASAITVSTAPSSRFLALSNSAMSSTPRAFAHA